MRAAPGLSGQRKSARFSQGAHEGEAALVVPMGKARRFFERPMPGKTAITGP